MGVTLWYTATEYLSNAITLTRGDWTDIVSVGLYHSAEPNYVPDETDFEPVDFIYDLENDSLSDGVNHDVISLIGPKSGKPALVLAAGDYQRWVMVKTVSEVIIRKVDTITIATL